MGDISSYGQKRLLSANTTASASWIVAGRYPTSTIGEDLSKTDWENHLFSLGKLQGEGRQRGVEISFFGVGAENATINYRVWRAKRGYNPFNCRYASQPSDIDFDLICTGVATLGATTLNLPDVVPSDTLADIDANFPVGYTSTRIADTITVTNADAGTSPQGIADYLGSGLASPDPAVYSPANDTPAKLMVAEMGGGDLYLEFWVGTATSANALVEAFE